MDTIAVPPATYDARYYGVPGAGAPRANYRGYTATAQPHWVDPVARMLTRRYGGRLVDLGCAYGHLVARLPAAAAYQGDPERWQVALGVELSTHAARHPAPGATVLHASGLHIPLPDGWASVVLSMDYLEHFIPVGTRQAIAEADRVLAPGGASVHLVGWPRDGASDDHYADPTHRNHEHLDWYVAAFTARGYRHDAEASARFNHHPVWRGQSWDGRWAVFTKGAEATIFTREQRHAALAGVRYPSPPPPTFTAVHRARPAPAPRPLQRIGV